MIAFAIVGPQIKRKFFSHISFLTLAEEPMEERFTDAHRSRMETESNRQNESKRNVLHCQIQNSREVYFNSLYMFFFQLSITYWLCSVFPAMPLLHAQNIPLILTVMTISVIICNGNRTEWSPIRSVIILVITKSDDRAAGVRFVYHQSDYGPNWTTRSLITT